MRAQLIFWCIGNYYVHNVVRNYDLVGMWKIEANNQKLTNNFTTIINSKVLLHLPPFGHHLKGEFRRFTILWVGESYGLGVAPIKSPSTTFRCFSIQSFASSDVAWPELYCQIMAPQSELQFGGLGWTYGVENVDPAMRGRHFPLHPHSYSTSIQTIGLFCTIWPYTQRSRRQTERLE